MIDRTAASIPPRFADRKGDEPADGAVAEVVARLVQEAQRGDRDAFGALYRRFHGSIARMARFYLADAAEDAVAETFVRAFAALPRYRDTGAPFVSWLYGIARHVVSDDLASRRRVETRAEVPDRAIEAAQDDRLALAAAMERLPAEQRQVIELKFLVGLRNPEVAAALGKTVGAVNALQWRALQGLRGMVER